MTVFVGSISFLYVLMINPSRIESLQGPSGIRPLPDGPKYYRKGTHMACVLKKILLTDYLLGQLNSINEINTQGLNI